MMPSTLLTFMLFKLTMPVNAAEQDHHVTVDAGGAAKDAQAPDHLMRRIQTHDHESVTIPKEEFDIEKAPSDGENLLEVEDENATEEACTTYYYKPKPNKKIQQLQASCNTISPALPLPTGYDWQGTKLKKGSSASGQIGNVCKQVCASCGSQCMAITKYDSDGSCMMKTGDGSPPGANLTPEDGFQSIMKCPTCGTECDP